MLANGTGTETGDQGQTSGFVFRVQFLHQDLQVLGRRRRAAFQANRVQHARANSTCAPSG